MRLRKLGNSGLYVSELGFGAMTFGGSDGIWGQVGKLGQDDADALVKAALDAGINLFDTANTYADGRSEEILGRSLRNLGVTHDDVVVSTKGGAPIGDGPNERGSSRRHILTQCHASLRRLGLDHVDLYHIHEFDPETPIEETLEALEVLVRGGAIRYVGLSNWAAWQLARTVSIGQARGLAPIVSLQAYYSLVGRELEREIVPVLAHDGVGLMVWSPLAGGYLTGKYSSRTGSSGRHDTLDFPPIDRGRGTGIIDALRRIAQKHDCAPGHVALAWLLKQPVVSTLLVGARSVEQLRDNVQATVIELDEDDMAELNAASALPIEYPGWLLDRPRDRPK